jgi:high-affinity iron transporter
MTAALMLGFREALEAAVIISIIAGALKRAEMKKLFHPMWIAVVAAVVASGIAGALLSMAGIAFEGRAEEIFEGCLMLFAAGAISWTVLWITRNGRQLEQRLKSKTSAIAATGSWIGIFGLVFVSVFREGIELALFLTAAQTSSGTEGVIVGAVLGIIGAIVLGLLLYSGTIRLRVQTFFRVTSLLLIVIAAGLFAHGIHELQEAGIVPILVEHVWNLNPILDETSFVGQMLKAMFGYNGNPSLLETLGFALFLGTASLLHLSSKRKQTSPTCKSRLPAKSPTAAD